MRRRQFLRCLEGAALLPLNAAQHSTLAARPAQPKPTMTVNDPRHISNGYVIPCEHYCDQPYVVKTDNGAWLCVLTTGRGVEGERGQHVVATRSTDGGKTWSELIDVEPADGPEASYAVLLKTPGGRVYAFYNHNTDNRRTVKADDPPYQGGLCRRVDSLGYKEELLSPSLAPVLFRPITTPPPSTLHSND